MIDTFRPLNVGEAGLSCADDRHAISAARMLEVLDPPDAGEQA